MVRALLSLGLALALMVQNVAAQDSTLTYRVTLRSFLPSHCIRKSEYVPMYNYAAYTGANDSLYELPSLAGIMGNNAAFNLRGQAGPFYGNSIADSTSASVYCPYWGHMRNGTVKSHPDFEASSNSKTSGASQCYKGGQPWPGGCQGLSSVIKFEMETATSGLPKVVYCSDDPDGRCGGDGAAVEKFTTSRGRFFPAWYNDDPVYNKRVGDTITLDLQLDGTYYYNNQDFFPLNVMSTGVTEVTHPDPDLLRVWPNSLRENNLKHYWFTTELHTYFEYSGTELFRFRGDDDVWVWIDGKLAVDLGSTHGPVSDEILLSDYANETFLNLTVGEVYSFDMFHAERHYSQSTFRMTTTLSSTCNVARSGTNTFDMSVASAASLYLGRGSAFDAASATLRLAAPGLTLPYASTHAFLLQQQNVGAGFIAEFDFVAADASGIEGFAFVMHARPDGLTNLPQSTGANLGFRYLTHSLAVVFDMCADRMSNPGACRQQSVRLHYPSAATDFNDASNATRTVFDGVMRSLHLDGDKHSVRIEYLQRPDWFEVYIDNSLYLRQTGFNVLEVLGGRNAYVGFTTATAGAVPQLNITGLNLTAVRVDASKTLPVDLTELAPSKEILGDGIDAAGFSIFTRDFCENVLDYGGYGSMMRAYFVPVASARRLRALQAVNASDAVPATIRDNGDGTYSALLSTTDLTPYALYACFGVGCDFNLTDMTPLDPGSTAWYGSVASAITVRALTAAPTASPTVTAPTAAADTGSAVLASSVGGGSALFVLLVVGGILFVLRRRWQRDRAFIEEGALYNMEREVTYDKNDEYSVVGRMVLNTTAAIQRERAQKNGGDGTDAGTLEAENAELQEQIRINKQRQQEQQQQAAAAAVFTGGKAKGKKKKEFEAKPPHL